MTNNEALSARHTELCRAQRAAYNAWQAAPAGHGAQALEEYLKASRAVPDFNKMASETA